VSDHPSCQACTMARQVGRPGCSVHYPPNRPIKVWPQGWDTNKTTLLFRLRVALQGAEDDRRYRRAFLLGSLLRRLPDVVRDAYGTQWGLVHLEPLRHVGSGGREACCRGTRCDEFGELTSAGRGVGGRAVANDLKPLGLGASCPTVRSLVAVIGHGFSIYRRIYNVKGLAA
jgi:hypothetical protein